MEDLDASSVLALEFEVEEGDLADLGKFSPVTAVAAACFFQTHHSGACHLPDSPDMRNYLLLIGRMRVTSSGHKEDSSNYELFSLDCRVLVCPNLVDC